MGKTENELQALTLAEKFNSYERTQFNPKNIEMQTDITHEEVWFHSLANKLGDTAINRFGVDLRIRELLFEKEVRAPSDDRQSRKEATEVYKSRVKGDAEGKEGGTLSTLVGKG